MQNKKEKIIAALLAFFLGAWGFHWFYLGNTELGKKYLIWCLVGIFTSFLVVGFIPLVILEILGIVDCFKFLFMDDDEFNGTYNHSGDRQILND